MKLLTILFKKVLDNSTEFSIFLGIIVFAVLLLISSLIIAFIGFLITTLSISLIQKSYNKAVLRFEEAKKEVEKLEAHDLKTFLNGIRLIKSTRGNWNCESELFEVKGMIFNGYRTNPYNIKIFSRIDGPFCKNCGKTSTRPNCNKSFFPPFGFRYKFPCGHSKYFSKETPYTIFFEAKNTWLTEDFKVVKD